jgi:ubiquinone/menaquinone biosynthesis C-methylase UbiE
MEIWERIAETVELAPENVETIFWLLYNERSRVLKKGGVSLELELSKQRVGRVLFTLPLVRRFQVTPSLKLVYPLDSEVN